MLNFWHLQENFMWLFSLFFFSIKLSLRVRFKGMTVKVKKQHCKGLIQDHLSPTNRPLCSLVEEGGQESKRNTVSSWSCTVQGVFSCALRFYYMPLLKTKCYTNSSVPSSPIKLIKANSSLPKVIPHSYRTCFDFVCNTDLSSPTLCIIYSIYMGWMDCSNDFSIGINIFFWIWLWTKGSKGIWTLNYCSRSPVAAQKETHGEWEAALIAEWYKQTTREATQLGPEE